MADQASRVRKLVESTLKHNTFDLCYLAEGQAGLREQLEAEARGRQAALAALAVANERLGGTKARVGELEVNQQLLEEKLKEAEEARTRNAEQARINAGVIQDLEARLADITSTADRLSREIEARRREEGWLCGIAEAVPAMLTSADAAVGAMQGAVSAAAVRAGREHALEALAAQLPGLQRAALAGAVAGGEVVRLLADRDAAGAGAEALRSEAAALREEVEQRLRGEGEDAAARDGRPRRDEALASQVAAREAECRGLREEVRALGALASACDAAVARAHRAAEAAGAATEAAAIWAHAARAREAAAAAADGARQRQLEVAVEELERLEEAGLERERERALLDECAAEAASEIERLRAVEREAAQVAEEARRLAGARDEAARAEAARAVAQDAAEAERAARAACEREAGGLREEVRALVARERALLGEVEALLRARDRGRGP